MPSKPVVYEGICYQSVKALAREKGLDYSSLSHFYYKKKDIGEAVECCLKCSREKPVLWGRAYQSVSEVALKFGLPYGYLAYQMNAGCSLQDAVKRGLEKEPIVFRGTHYTHFADLCAAYQMQPSNVYDRLYYGLSLEDALTKPVKGMGNKSPVIYQGKAYESQIALCREYGISALCVREQLKTQLLTFVDAVDVFVRLKERMEIPWEEPVNYIPHARIRGKNYKTAGMLMQEFHLTAMAFYTYKNRSGSLDIFEVLQAMQSERRGAYLVDGKPFFRTDLEKQGYSCSRIKMLEKVDVPRYPQLQGFDFKTGCYDGEKIYYEILNEKLLEKGLVGENEMASEIKLE